MKKYLLFLLGALAIYGCNKSPNYNYGFDVNGALCQGNNYSAIYQYDTAAALKEFVADFYIGNVADTNYVQVSFSGNTFIAPGTYYSGITNAGNTVCSFAYVINHVYYSNVSGIVQILQVDTVGHKIAGNFQFQALSTVNAHDSVVISNGAFALNYSN